MKSCSLILAGITIALSAYPQGAFRNLGFEEAELVFVPGSNFTLEASRAVPGWSLASDWIVYDTIALDVQMVSLHDTRSIYADVLSGDYSILFQMSSDFSRTPALWQTGKVPELSLSLRFTTRAFRWNNYFDVTFNGTELPVQVISTSSDGTIWGADISDIAGQTGELKFQGVGVLDGIEFSPVAIPEPGIWSFVLLGGGVMVANRRGPRSRQR